MKYAILLLLALLSVGCREVKDPWDYVTAEEERQVFMACVRAAPPGDASVRDCDRAAESWVLATGLERKQAADRAME